MTMPSEKLWETFNIPLQQFIRRRVRDQHSAEDILQDVFLKIHLRIDTLHSQERIASWIYQITRNAIADYYRAQRPTAELAETLPVTDELVDDDVRPPPTIVSWVPGCSPPPIDCPGQAYALSTRLPNVFVQYQVYLESSPLARPIPIALNFELSMFAL